MRFFCIVNNDADDDEDDDDLDVEAPEMTTVDTVAKRAVTWIFSILPRAGSLVVCLFFWPAWQVDTELGEEKNEKKN